MSTRSALLSDLESDHTVTEASVGVLETAFTPFASPAENAQLATGTRIPVSTRSQPPFSPDKMLDSQRAKPSTVTYFGIRAFHGGIELLC
jgi:hypothetical protein